MANFLNLFLLREASVKDSVSVNMLLSQFQLNAQLKKLLPQLNSKVSHLVNLP